VPSASACFWRPRTRWISTTEPLSNAGIWCIGRLQTDADRERVVDGLSGTAGKRDKELDGLITRLAPRWFVLRNVHAPGPPVLLTPRYAMSYLKGPLTRVELKRALAARSAPAATER
jgi:hypothetical protein